MVNNNEKISVIVPVYNVEQYLRRCLRSIIAQTHENLEIILVDDGSPDNCGHICDLFAEMDDRIIVIHQENAGVCAARNAALRIATGDYYGFIDPDDHIEPDMYEYLLENLHKYDADISSCRYYRETTSGKVTLNSDGVFYEFNSKDAIEELLKINTIKASFVNKLFKKELFDGVEFPEGVIYEGTLMVHKIFLKANKILFLPEAKYYYQIYHSSYVHTKTLRNQCDYVRATITRYNDLIPLFPDFKETIIRKIIKEVSHLAITAYINPADVEANMEDLHNFAEFLEENADYIDGLSGISFISRNDIKFIKDPSAANLRRVKLLHEAFDKENKPMITNIKKSRLRQLGYTRKPRIRININDLTDEDMVLFNKLHETELEIMDELVRICDKHNITYFLYGGTLLGAVRHKGFIPWDDDIDLAMPREDFDRFAEVCRTELGEKYFYQSFETDPGYTLLFAKLRKNGTHVQEEKFEGIDIHEGIYIDIMPLDYFPEISGYRKRALLAKFNILQSACKPGDKSGIHTRHKINRLRFKMMKRKPKDELVRERDHFIRNATKGKKTSLVCSFGSHYLPMSRRVFPAKWFEDDGTKMEFEGRMFKVPAGWKEYLTDLFGDSYMEWPPVSERMNHFNFYNVDFGEEDGK